jgi:TatD DNase family protein
LDFNRNFSPPDVQEQWFAAQVALALELRKPLFMHCRWGLCMAASRV